MIVIENKTALAFDTTLLERIATTLTEKEIELILTDDDEIQEVNLSTRGIDKATDVLSFPLEALEGFPLGSIMISMDRANDVAQALGHSVEEEIALLFIHGLLHLLGYDHETDKGQMRRKEERLIETFDLPKSLIVRNG